jgi:hypothetical protein
MLDGDIQIISPGQRAVKTVALLAVDTAGPILRDRGWHVDDVIPLR